MMQMKTAMQEMKFTVSRLDEVCEVIMGQAPRGESYNLEGKGLPLIAGAGDFGDTYPVAKKFTTEASKISRIGDIILGIRATIGEKVLSDGEYCLGRGVAALRTYSMLDSRYLWHWLEHIRLKLASKAKGATFKQVTREDIAELKITLPPIAEQKRIAAILDRAEELRGLRRKALGELDAIVQSIFLKMFGNPMMNSQGWEMGALQDIADFQTGYPFTSIDYTTEGETVKLCRGANILPTRIDWNDLACWSKLRMNAVAEFALQLGDVVIAMDRPWISAGFKIAQIQQKDLPALLVQRVARLRGKDSCSNSFIFQLLKLPVFTDHCKPTETTIPHISPKDIKTFRFPIPPIELQKEFAWRVEAIEQLKTTHRESLAQLNALFASLQHRAFQGEL